jgi:hypothetical protein
MGHEYAHLLGWEFTVNGDAVWTPDCSPENVARARHETPGRVPRQT